MKLGYRLVLVVAMIAVATRASADNSSAGGKAPRSGAGQVPSERRSKTELRALHIDTSTVLCIAQLGIQPSGKPVLQKGKRPAGIALFGVSALGVGVLDGDVLTEVLGQPVRSQFQVIAIVIAARNANMSMISGTLWRGAHAYSVTVDQPYQIPDCTSDDPDCWRTRCKDDKPNGVAVPTTSPPPKSKAKAASKH